MQKVAHLASEGKDAQPSPVVPHDRAGQQLPTDLKKHLTPRPPLERVEIPGVVFERQVEAEPPYEWLSLTGYGLTLVLTQDEGHRRLRQWLSFYASLDEFAARVGYVEDEDGLEATCIALVDERDDVIHLPLTYAAVRWASALTKRYLADREQAEQALRQLEGRQDAA